MRTVFLDTSAVFAAARPASDRHVEALAAYRVLFEGRERLVTSDLVLAEIHALTLHRASPTVALDLVSRLASSGRIEVLTTGRDRLEEALELLRSRPGRRYSLADAVSFVLMRELGADTAFALDADFAAEGFALLPAPT